MEALLLIAAAVFILICVRKATDPKPIFTDTIRRPKQAENKPLPLIEFKTNPRIIRSPDHHPDHDDSTFFI